MAILADAITPLTHFFHRETLIPNLVLFTVIILTEAYLLKRIIKPIPFTKHLLFSFIINLGSSIAGSLVLLTKDSFAPLSYMSCGALVFLFALTLIVEYPIIAYLYKNKLPQRRFITVDFKINIVSYALSFVVGLVIIFGTISHLSRLDKKIMREWTHSEIIREESGTIFTVRRNENKKGYCLQSYELQTQTWVKTPVNIPDRSKWDISIDGNLIAFSDAGAVIQRLSEPDSVSFCFDVILITPI